MTLPTENAGAVSLLFRVWSRVYDNPLPQQLFYRRVHRRIVGAWRPKPGERVLDVGCGTGLFLKSLAAGYDGLSLTGLDLSEHMLSQARRGAAAAAAAAARSGRSVAPVFVQGSVYEMPFADGAFDVALNSISCHFYLEPVRAFREVCRVLAPGGRFFCAALTAGFPGRTPLARIAAYYPVAVLTQHFREAGFDVTSCERMFPAVALFALRKLP